MSEKGLDEAMLDETEQQLDEAEELANQQAETQDLGSFTYTFKRPWEYGSHTYTELHFQWDALTAKDFCEIDRQIMRTLGKTVVMRAIDSDFLLYMAVFACTDRDERGVRILSKQAMEHMPGRAFDKICSSARSFLLYAD